MPDVVREDVTPHPAGLCPHGLTLNRCCLWRRNGHGYHGDRSNNDQELAKHLRPLQTMSGLCTLKDRTHLGEWAAILRQQAFVRVDILSGSARPTGIQRGQHTAGVVASTRRGRARSAPSANIQRAKYTCSRRARGVFVWTRFLTTTGFPHVFSSVLCQKQLVSVGVDTESDYCQLF